MFENLNGWEFVALILVALFIFGPERLPKMIADAARTLRTVRTMARNATSDLRNEIGGDIDLDDLNPKTFVRKHLLSEEDEEQLFRRPLRSAYDDMRNVATRFGEDDTDQSGAVDVSTLSKPATAPAARVAEAPAPTPAPAAEAPAPVPAVEVPAPAVEPPAPASAVAPAPTMRTADRRFDPDAT